MTAGGGPSGEAGRISVLTVSGAADGAEETARSLEDADDRIEVVTAAGPAEAVEAVAGRDVDCVVSGYELPSTDGVELLREVRAAAPDLPFVLFTDAGSEAVADEAVAAGVSGYVPRTAAGDPYGHLADRVVDVVESASGGRRQRRAVERLHGATRDLVAAQTREAIVERGSRAVDEILGFTTNSIRLYDPEADALVVSARSPRSEELLGELDPYEVDDTAAGRAFRTGEPVLVDVSTDGSADLSPLVQALYVPVGDHGVISMGVTEGEFEPGQVKLAEILAANLTTALDREAQNRELREQERQLEALLEVTRELPTATSKEGVAELASDAVMDVLNLPVNAIRRYDPETETLVPMRTTAVTEAEIGPRPPYDVETSPAGRAFRAGGTVISDVEPDDPYRRGTVVQSLYVPLGEHGVLGAAAFSADDLDEPTVRLAEVFATNVRAAFDRVEREQELKRQKRRLEVVAANAPVVLYALDGDGRFTLSEGRALEALGLAPGEVVGESVFDVYEGLDDVLESCRRALAGERAHSVVSIGDAHFETWLVPVTDGGEAGVVGVAVDVTERERHRRQLERENERLDEFASIVSHDLRNPLAVLDGSLQLAEESGEATHFDRCHRAIDRMEALIDDLLALARGGERIDELERVALADLVEGCWETVATGEAALTVDTEATIRADASRLRQLLENLFRNAVEHGGESVTVTVGDLDDGFSVEDDGRGVPPGEWEQIFEAGYSTGEEGTGLGLLIVEQVAEAHGWRVRACEGRQGGLRFEVRGVELVDA